MLVWVLESFRRLGMNKSRLLAIAL
ncbi:hypothetical protein Q5691_03025 [Microcoleus sp. w1-18aA5]